MPHSSDPFLLQLLVIFVWAKIFGELFEQMSMPAVLGEILAGVILGPFATAFVVPSSAVVSVSGLGAIFLLFSVGLETHPEELIDVGRTSIRVALAGVFVPFVLGFGFILLQGQPAREATFIATAMVATSVGITARVMGDLQVLHTRAAKIVLAAAVFDDILGMVLLAVVAGLAGTNGIQWVQLIVLLAEAVGFAIFMMFFAPRVIHHMRGRMTRLSIRNAPLMLALAICLGLSVAAEKIGMAAIVGAFFAGIAFAKYAPEWELRPRVGAITEFLTPFFFFLMGAQLNLGAFSRSTIISAVVITFLAIISKLLGCGLPMLAEGWRTALKVGIGMTPRGEVGLIVALIGLNAKMITESAYAVVIIMVGLTTVFAPPILRVLFHKEAGFAEARQVAVGE